MTVFSFKKTWVRRGDAEGEEEGAPLRRQPLAPTDSVAGRSLVILIAIMTFLASLALGAALLIAEASAGWRAEAAREATIQVRPLPGRDLDADVRAAADIAREADGVREVIVYTRAESEALLAPWLGTGLDLSELPTPRMIVLRLKGDMRVDRVANLSALREELAKKAPAAALDDHRLWLERLGAMAGVVVGLAALIFALVVAAMAIVVVSATRAAVATNREIVEVLHMVGAADDFIAREFQRRFLGLGLRGALIGSGAGVAFFALAQLLPGSLTATPSGDQLEGMFGDLALGAGGYAAIAVLAGAIAVLTGQMSRLIVLRRLRELD
ncbi:MAG TPA: ABC transporter permease [Methylocystis sp.]|nr:ABC transporter permease [Methylocystis sp.]